MLNELDVDYCGWRNYPVLTWILGDECIVKSFEMFVVGACFCIKKLGAVSNAIHICHGLTFQKTTLRFNDAMDGPYLSGQRDQTRAPTKVSS